MVSPVEKYIPTTNRFSALNGLYQEDTYEDPPFDSNHDPGPSTNTKQWACRPTPTSTSPSSQINQLTTNTRSLIKLRGTVKNQPAIFLIDSGATGNFINSAFVKTHSLPTKSLPRPDSYYSADGSQQTAAEVTDSTLVRIDSYSDKLDLVAVPLAGYDVILGMPWLHHYDPYIQWSTSTVTFVDSSNHPHRLVSSSNPEHSIRAVSPSNQLLRQPKLLPPGNLLVNRPNPLSNRKSLLNLNPSSRLPNQWSSRHV